MQINNSAWALFRKPNRTEPHRTEISVCSVFCCRFGLWFCTVRCSASASGFFSNQTEEPNKPKCSTCRPSPDSPHALTRSRPQSLTAHSSTAHQDAKESRKPPSGHPAAQRVERQRRSPQPLIPNPKSSSGGRRATGAGHGEPARRREAGG